ncbi:Hpt domain-containing protein [Herminiimonas fonticola]|uniref:Chemotaxis protein CheA n=1 Tax=Herminiimonas fonticola TaxID=303380 RepID=A0A4R6GH57_9BURK|nr:Hpt domain-containing protein [Herminiimonas fonticola]RBA25186.1 Response regulator receiver domain [Herminiimonas fonticola]TDN94301.1 chemosensory pili system protein ChpA (sensor histidine kinase/response regulator) [Herminiimonas fonticola]
MNTPSSSLPQGKDSFDTGPLSWVIAEIGEALTRSKVALGEALTQDPETQSTTLRHAKTYLHQAHGALQIVDVDGVAIITETVEDLFDRFESGQLTLTDDSVHAIAHAYQALLEYLEELLAGMPHQPVRLFPYYRSLLQVRGAERIHPADLFFPNLAIRPQFPAASITLSADDYVGLRKRFERALLIFLKEVDSETGLASARTMRDIVLRVEQAQSTQQARSFWWVMHGFADAVSAGQVPNELYVKQLFARINLQIRRLGEGSSSITERLLRDALFFIARVAHPSAAAQQIRSAYQLDGVVPNDYEKKRYGQIDAQALAAAKERLSQAKNLWNRVASGDATVAASFEQEMTGLAEAGNHLNAPALAKLLRELSGIARHAAHSRPGDSLSLEIATSLLFVENALQQIGHLADDFAERADAVTTRLLSAVSGETLTHSAQWLDDMSREAQERQTMTALAGEMQSSLRQVEKMLDEYFRDPEQRAGLSDIDSVLYQISGALAVLGHEDAMRAVQHTQAAVRCFIDAEETPELQEFQQVAQNVGALSFFIETLQLHPDGVNKRFSFDDQAGIFRANLTEKNGPSHAALDVVVIPMSTVENTISEMPEIQVPDLPTVESELAFHQKQSEELAISLAAEPTNPFLQEQLKESLEQVRLDARLVDNPEANERARAVIDMLEHPDFVASQDAMDDIALATAPAKASHVKEIAPLVAPATDEAIDAELLEIFLSEAVEVLDSVKETAPDSRNAPHNQEFLTTLRRSFHTLKGSGRMVGLVTFGEAAWSVEQVLNLRLSDTRGGDADLYALLEKAVQVLDAWVGDLQMQGRSDRNGRALIDAAERVKDGEGFHYDEMEETQLVSPIEEAFTETASNTGAESIAASTADFGSEDAVAATEAEELELSDEELAQFQKFNATADEVAEVVAEPTMLESVVGELDHLKIDVVSEAAPLQVAAVLDFPGNPPAAHKSDDNVKYIGNLEISLPLHNIYLAETDELVRMLSQDIAEWRHEPDRHVNIPTVHAAHSLAGSSATVGFKPLQQIAYALEAVLQYLARKPVKLLISEYDTLDHAISRIRFMLQMFALGEMPDFEPEQAEILERMPEDFEFRISSKHGQSVFDTAALNENQSEVADASVFETEPLPAFEQNNIVDPAPVLEVRPAVEPLPAISEIDPAPFEEPSYPQNSEELTDPALIIKDEIDADLLPVFIEEGTDMLPQMGQALRAWQQALGDTALPQSILRILHTIKGSARMAGAMLLGQHMHEMETRIENITHAGYPSAAAVEDLLARHDHGLQLFEQLQNPDAPKQQSFEAANLDKENIAEEELPVIQSLMPVTDSRPATAMIPGVSPVSRTVASAAPVSLVRVRADILDRLVNQAGEVSISRSKLETEVGTLRMSMGELSENVSRLREQLREIEMQAESQITSHMGVSADREFDPLEFDRFTRLQELTRMMAESVNDVGSVQQNLSRTIDSASSDLTNQARLTRDLQQDLMRVRMVQFASISERLYRVTRQAAKEVDKRVNLDIRGSAVEVDRGVLEKMVGPFEHLLRNAIVHGIESREKRKAAGKNETGELRVEIRQEGNEVVIHFSDDGQGLNLNNIRKKALENGLVTDDDKLSDAEITDLIFHPGFSTAEEVTELAGRGIGMDVVRSEAASLGGRVAIASEAGKGAYFTIHLPLTLAVTQVVILSTGGKTYALPSVLVEQVQQLKNGPLAIAYNEGAVMWQSQRVPMHYLSTLLGDTDAAPVTQQYSPLLILKSGNDRVALHVDEILGNREVVVKNIGPQLSRMIGIAGATVLGSGEIVLILNPVPLAQRAAHENIRAPRLTPSDVPNDMGAVAEMATFEPAARNVEPVQGLRTQHIVMVVDDSLTVRRVTQRLLTREGYQVVLAKDGVDALQHLQSITPDVMLVDIEMPRMDGFDLTRNIRGDERTRDIPIIMITSRTASKHRNYAMELGVNEYLGKPYQEEALVKLIAGFIKKEVPVN